MVVSLDMSETTVFEPELRARMQVVVKGAQGRSAGKGATDVAIVALQASLELSDTTVCGP